MNNACIVVDFRKSRIRIFKRTLQELLYPKYVRLLVNPNEKTVAVQVTDSADTRAHSRETPVWCMIYNDLAYEEEADIFANQR